MPEQKENELLASIHLDEQDKLWEEVEYETSSIGIYSAAEVNAELMKRFYLVRKPEVDIQTVDL